VRVLVSWDAIHRFSSQGYLSKRYMENFQTTGRRCVGTNRTVSLLTKRYVCQLMIARSSSSPPQACAPSFWQRMRRSKSKVRLRFGLAYSGTSIFFGGSYYGGMLARHREPQVVDWPGKGFDVREPSPRPPMPGVDACCSASTCCPDGVVSSVRAVDPLAAQAKTDLTYASR